jgi:hypothetical protein
LALELEWNYGTASNLGDETMQPESDMIKAIEYTTRYNLLDVWGYLTSKSLMSFSFYGPGGTQRKWNSGTKFRRGLRFFMLKIDI